MTDTAIFPVARPRRLRTTPTMRSLVRETTLTPQDFIYPLFVRDGQDIQLPIRSMPGQYQWSPDMVAREARQIRSLGIPAVILFGIPSKKDALGSENYNPDGVVARTIRMIKDAVPDLLVISDMCFCEYTNHGHCGIINTADDRHYDAHLPEGYLLNEPTLELLGHAAVIHAQAGADIIAPSGMIDGMVSTIRHALDEAHFQHVPVMSYAVKYSSAFYGPFRDAAESPPLFGDRTAYQMDPANQREALKEAAIDVAEGADMLMVKPALAYLDILSTLRQTHTLPLAAYQVSGEYSMLHAAANNGWLDLERAALESLISIKRAGADIILTYFAQDAVRWLEK
jgi:porphobilinogen synthase